MAAELLGLKEHAVPTGDRTETPESMKPMRSLVPVVLAFVFGFAGLCPAQVDPALANLRMQRSTLENQLRNLPGKYPDLTNAPAAFHDLWFASTYATNVYPLFNQVNTKVWERMRLLHPRMREFIDVLAAMDSEAHRTFIRQGVAGIPPIRARAERVFELDTFREQTRAYKLFYPLVMTSTESGGTDSLLALRIAFVRGRTPSFAPLAEHQAAMERTKWKLLTSLRKVDLEILKREDPTDWIVQAVTQNQLLPATPGLAEAKLMALLNWSKTHWQTVGLGLLGCFGGLAATVAVVRRPSSRSRRA